MVWIYSILIFLAFCYALISSVLHIGVFRLRKRTKRDLTLEAGASSSAPEQEQRSTDLPFVSILVPARDEERFIADCLESLVNQDYPSDRYEIVVVNDRSTDNTPAIIREYMEKHEIVKCVNVNSNLSGLTGKQNALNEGLRLCSGEIILNTDADCIAGPLWTRRMLARFTPRIGMVAGFHRVQSVNGSGSLLADLQSLDMLFLMDAAAGAIGVNIPTACSGSNLAYRKAVLDDIGYPGTRYTITEDTALIRKAAKDANWSIAVVYDKDASVLTFAEEKIKQFLSQRIRWVLGGQATRSWSQIPLHIIFLFHLSLAISFPLMFFVRPLMFAVLFSILIKTTLDFVVCWRVCREFDRTDLLKLFVPYEMFMISYSILAGFGSIFIRKVRWKGELYTRYARYIHTVQ